MIDEMLGHLARHYGATPRAVDVAPLAVPGMRRRRCYDNAYAWVCAHEGDVHYVLGYLTLHGVPIEHAWVRRGPDYFDITPRDARPGDRYYACAELDLVALTELVEQCGVAPSLHDHAGFERAATSEGGGKWR